jgi:hypothetical protein
MVFQMGDLVLLRTKELLDSDAEDIGKLRPFSVTACPGPNAYTLSLPSRMQCSPTVNVDRLKPFFERARVAPAPGPVSDVGQDSEGEHEVELRLLLNRAAKRGVTRYLVRWRRPHVGRRQVAAGGGAAELSGEGGVVRCSGPPPLGRQPG